MFMWMLHDWNNKIMRDQNVYVFVTWLEWKENSNYQNVYVNVTWLEYKKIMRFQNVHVNVTWY
jgi:hypothetical protein